MAAVEARRVASDIDIDSAEAKASAVRMRHPSGLQRAPTAATAIDDAELAAATARALSTRLASRLETLRAIRDTAIAERDQARAANAQAVAANRAAYGGPSTIAGLDSP